MAPPLVHPLVFFCRAREPLRSKCCHKCNAGLVLAGIVLYSEKVNTVQAGGYLVSLIAFGAYSALESSNSKSAHNNGKGDVSAAAEPKSAKEKTSS